MPNSKNQTTRPNAVIFKGKKTKQDRFPTTQELVINNNAKLLIPQDLPNNVSQKVDTKMLLPNYLISRAFHGSCPDRPITSGGYRNLADRVGSGQEVFGFSRDGSGRIRRF